MNKSKMKAGLMRSLAASMLLFCGQTAIAQADDDEREGGVTGTGIVGMITEVSSIFVNGHRVDFDADLPVNSPLADRAAEALEPGETVAALVQPIDGAWTATSLSQVYPVIGPITDLDGTGVTVMGTRIDGRTTDVDFLGLKAGDWIAVSGFWQFDRVMATHIRAIDPQQHALIQGSFLRPGKDNVIRIGTARIDGPLPDDVAPGTILRVTGAPVDGGILVERVATGLFADRPLIVQSEGYLSPADASGFYTLLGAGGSSTTDNPDMIDPKQLVVQCDIDRRLLGEDHVHDDAALRAIAELLGCR